MLTELESQGYAEGKNLNIKYWSLGNAEGRAKRAWLQEQSKNYDVVFVNGTVATLNFKEFAYGNNKFKFVFGAVTDPVGVGVIDNFESAPKANFTGVCYPVKVEERLRFIQKVMPNAKNIGLIYADMPQSHSYVKWVEAALKLDEFKDLKFHFRKVDFVKSEGGHKRMTLLAKKHVKELDSKVDVFISPNDQMGVQEPFAKMVYETATKPLIGLGKKDVMQNWGATMSIYPSLEGAGNQIGKMIAKILKGAEVKEIIPQWPSFGVAFDLKKAKKLGFKIPADMVEKAGADVVR